jgi:hypothetical protein
MTDADLNALIQAEIDGELDAAGRAELARRSLADPGARALRDEYRRLAALLEGLPAVEPPEALARDIFAALPQPQAKGSRLWSMPWRLAALLAGVLIAGTLVFETVEGPSGGSGPLSGTIVASPPMTMIDTVRLGDGPGSARVSLYRDHAQLAVKVEMAANPAADVVIANGDFDFRIRGADRGADAGSKLLLLPAAAAHQQSLDVALEVAGRTVAHATMSTGGS